MSEISAIADWLRQREGETDAAWIERLRALFEAAPNPPDDPKADRIGERLWQRYLSGRKGAAREDK